jgi:hypothetical protein
VAVSFWFAWELLFLCIGSAIPCYYISVFIIRRTEMKKIALAHPEMDICGCCFLHKDNGACTTHTLRCICKIRNTGFFATCSVHNRHQSFDYPWENDIRTIGEVQNDIYDCRRVNVGNLRMKILLILEQELLDLCHGDYEEWHQCLKSTYPPEE